LNRLYEIAMARIRIAPASTILRTAAEICAAIETSDDPLMDRRLNAIAAGARELIAGAMPVIQRASWRYGSRSRPGQVAHTVTSTMDRQGQRVLECTCEAGGPEDACWHRGHRAILEQLSGHPLARLFPHRSAQEEIDELFERKAG
jgi:hypothetical protein